MDQSDEEEEFQSADEDGFEEETKRESMNDAEKLSSQKTRETDDGNRQCNDAVINKDAVESSEKRSLVGEDLTKQEGERSATSEPGRPSESKPTEVNPEFQKPSDKHDTDDDEEDALAERIRERNLKLARKFSAEIAKNIQASAPIPVKTSKQDRESQFNDDQDPLDGKLSVAPPPAPPSTPALSSSYNVLNDPTMPTAGTSLSMNTQYTWRIPPKVAASQQQSNSGSSTPSRTFKPDEQARQVLDRLSERLSRTDKNLFEQVAADVKKVTLKNEEVPTTTADLPSALTSITDLGSTLGGWGWTGATKILSSASQVTSQVSSVLDSVVGVAEPSVQQAEDTTRTNEGKLSTPIDETGPGDTKTERVPKDVTYNDPLVDFTLNAMESLGKKAFGVMTTRDKAGSLQIKGLGRPWESLISTLKVDDTPGEEVLGEPLRDRSPSPPATESEDICTASRVPEHRSDSPPPPSTLKLRKRRND